MKRFKIKIENLLYKYITKWYIKLTNKRNFTFEKLKDEYTYTFKKEFSGCNYSIHNPIEAVYFVLVETYSAIHLLNIEGITMDYTDKDYIKVNITTARPGLIIGRNGQDISRLTINLSRYFGKNVVVILDEAKTDFGYSNY